MILRLLPLVLIVLAESLPGAFLSSPQGAVAFVNADSRDGLALRRAVEESEKSFFQVTGYDPGEAPPVLIGTREKGAAASLSVNALEGGGPEIRLVLPTDPEDSQVPLFLATALLLRQYYGKTAPVPGSGVPRYPDWLTHGLGSLILQRSAAEAATASSPELEAFLTERVPDPGNVSLLRRYDAVASVLVRSGLSDDRGRKAFRDWIGCYDSSAPSRPVSSWVEGWEMRSVERRWVLGLHVPVEKEQLSIRIRNAASTLEEYGRIMKEGLSDKGSLADVARERGGEYRLQKLAEKLSALRLQGNPLVVPLVEETMGLVAIAKRTSPKKVLREEEQLRAKSLALAKQARAIEDYLDWYEAAKVTIPSGVFEPYLAVPVSHPGKGPIGRYLDQIEARGW
jgi:hypothetical protein